MLITHTLGGIARRGQEKKMSNAMSSGNWH
jgi:hypothetical protein